MQLLFPLAVWLAITSGADWIWWAIAFCAHVVYAVVGNNIALHRYFSHKQFTVSPPVEKLFVWVSSMCGLGSPLGYAMIHLVHHKYADTIHDPHGRTSCGLKSVLVCFHKDVDLTATPINTKRVVELSKKYGWLHQWYVLFIVANAAMLFLINYKLFLFIWLLPATFTVWAAAIAVVCQHWNNEPNNGWYKIHQLLWTYDSLHKNHHDWPMAPNAAVRPNEIDYAFQFSRLFRPKYNWTGQPRGADHDNENTPT